MGIFRLLLALFVLLAHLPELAAWTNPFFGRMTGGTAVQAFFILSGFYMAMILDGKYNVHSPRSFYYSRLLKIFPIYYVVLISSFVLFLVIAGVGFDIYDYGYTPPSGYDYPSVISNVLFLSGGYLDALGIILLLFSHLFLVGQDMVFGLVTTPSGLMTVEEFRQTEVWQQLAVGAGDNESRWQPRLNVPYMTLEKYLLVPQAWSLGMELIFYGMAPFLLRIRSSLLLLLTVSFLSLRVIGLEATVWGNNGFFEYKFFPFEFVFFLIGVMSFRAYLWLQESDFQMTNLYRYGLAFVLCITALCFDLLPEPKNWLFYLIVATILPLSFKFDSGLEDRTMRSVRWDRFDRYVGDLSYPLYVSHLLVVSAAYALFQDQMRSLGRPIGQTVVVLACIVLAAILLRVVQGPIDRYRWQFTKARIETRAERRRKSRGKKKI